MLQKPEVSSGLMGHFTRTQTLPLPFTFQKAGEKTGGFDGMMGVFQSPLKNSLTQEHNFDISIKTFSVGIISVFKTWFLALLTSSTS